MIVPTGVRLTIAGLALAASAACTSNIPHIQGLDPCTDVGADTTGWKVTDAGAFRFSVPDPYQRQAVQGIDSYVGHWAASGGRAVRFDYGMYSSSLDHSSTQWEERAECTAEVGGHRVKLVGGFDAEGEGTGRTYVIVAAAWRDVPPGTHLTLTTMSRDPSDIPVLLSIVRSVRFQPATPPR